MSVTKVISALTLLLLFYAFPLHSRTSETLMRTKLCALPF